MFQEISHNRTHRDILTNSLDTCFQTADTTDDQLDLYTCRRGCVQRADNVRITQRIHLGNDMALFALAGIFCLPIDHGQEAFFHPQRRHDQVIPSGRL